MLLADYASLTIALGPRRVALNLLHRARVRSGWYRRRSPLRELALLPPAVVAAARSPFTVPSADFRLTADAAQELMGKSERICSGEMQYFSRHWLARPSSWRVNPRMNSPIQDGHWADCTESDPTLGDVKWIWEASRFDWAYVLGRAWRLCRDERAAQSFWSLLEDWLRDNPPNRGINWRCAQECSLRLISLVWSAAAFADSSESSPQRMRTLWSLVAELATRVRLSTAYAISQNNNHGLSEACALYLAGICLPRHRCSARWRALGRRLFLRQVREQFSADGFYIQNSFNYTRLALRVCLVFMLATRAADEPADEVLDARLRAAVGLLRTAIEPVSGRVPNYGANDGANVLSLSNAGYLDYRPVTQSVWYLLTGRRLFPSAGAADEELAWLGATDPALPPPEKPAQRDREGGESGYFILASGDSRLHIRCATHRSRPAHADMLHVDIWDRSVNLARDAGTFGYHDAAAWGAVLASSSAHNVVVVDGRDQMRKLSRFLWVDWTRARVLDARLHQAAGARFSGVHFGYRKYGVEHRRAIHGRQGDWLIIDDLIFARPGAHDLALHWHLDATLRWVPHAGGLQATRGEQRLDVAVSRAFSQEFVDSAADFPRNADSLFYGEADASALFIARSTAQESTRFVTAIGRTPLGVNDGGVSWHDLSVPLKPG